MQLARTASHPDSPDVTPRARTYRLAHALAWVMTVGIHCLPSLAHAQGVWELSAGGGYNRTRFTDRDFSWSRRYTGAVAFYFLESSQVELAVQTSRERVKLSGFQDTIINDTTMSVSWLQSFFGRQALFQPYLRLGVGQLNRDATGTFASGAQPPAILDVVTVVIGAGLRLRVSARLGVRVEAVSYLERGNINTWRNNVAINYGISLFL